MFLNKKILFYEIYLYIFIFYYHLQGIFVKEKLSFYYDFSSNLSI